MNGVIQVVRLSSVSFSEDACIKMLKKIFFSFISVTLILLPFLLHNNLAQAQGTATVSVNPSSSSIASNGSVTLQFRISNASNLGSFEFD
jgi:hypothetical protein